MCPTEDISIAVLTPLALTSGCIFFLYINPSASEIQQSNEFDLRRKPLKKKLKHSLPNRYIFNKAKIEHNFFKKIFFSYIRRYRHGIL